MSGSLNKELRVFKALSIASSDARDDTLKSIIISILFEKNSIAETDIDNIIISEFSFEPYKLELNKVLSELIESKKVFKENVNLRLGDDERLRINELNAAIKTKESQRFSNFDNFISNNLNLEVSSLDKKILWKEFLAYLYNCFYKHGYDALITLNPQMISASGVSSYEGVLNKSKINLASNTSHLIESFVKIVEGFTDFASTEDIEFLHDLAQKTSSFSSLGIDPELAQSGIERNLVDWVLYLDTNVLYSLLSLRYHPENEACTALIKLLEDNKDYIKVKLRYSSITYKELKSIKENFDKVDNSLTNSAITAMLKSGRLNGFMAQFYEGLLKSRDTAIHPSKIVDLSNLTLKNRGIDIGQNDARLSKIGEDIINAQVTNYYDFLDRRNKSKQEFCDAKGVQFHPISKGEKQVRHDVKLRELILDSRSLNEDEIPTLNTLKFFGLTLDENLMRFDKKMIKDNQKENSFPVFFRPSFLLNRLTKILPIKTYDYKQAFVKAITAKAYFRNTRHSNDVVQIVSYLRSQGIDNTDLIYDIISQDLILENYSLHKKDLDFNTGDFLESAINKKLRNFENDVSIFKEKANISEKASLVIQAKFDDSERQNEEYKILKEQFENASKILSNRVKKLESKKGLNSKQTFIDYDTADEISKLSDENRLLRDRDLERRRNNFRDEALKLWRRKVWWNLLWVVPFIILSFLMKFSSNNFPLNYIHDDPLIIANTIVIILMFFVTAIFLRIIFIRYWNPSSANAYKESLILPDELC